MDGPGTLNKTVLIKPPENIYSFNELVALWEKKIGKTLEKNYVAEEKLLKNIQGHWNSPLYTTVEEYLDQFVWGMELNKQPNSWKSGCIFIEFFEEIQRSKKVINW